MTIQEEQKQIQDNLRNVEEGKPLNISLAILNGEFKKKYREKFGDSMRMLQKTPKLNTKKTQLEKRRAYQKAYLKAYHKSDKYKASLKAYRKSDKFKAYRKSDKYKAYLKAYRKSDKYKASQKAYQKTDKCKAYRKAYRLKKKGGEK